MTPTKPTKAELRPYICLSCGSNGEALFWLHENGVPYQTAKCPKCSNRAINLGLVGFSKFMVEITKRLKAVESDIFDISASSDGEER